MECFGKRWEKNNACEKCGNIFSKKETEQKGFESRLKKEVKQEYESPARRYLDQVKCCNNTDCTHRMMKQGFVAVKGGDLE